MRLLESDFLVMGSGIAGLIFAHQASAYGTVHIVTKKEAKESNTNYAQGGIAAVMAETDSFENHIQDTLRAGAGLCRPQIVKAAVEEGPARIRELMALGVRFHSKGAQLDLGLEGGHSHRRILHAGDMTGRHLEQALIAACVQNPRIRFFENHLAIDLILQDHPRERPSERNRCLGAYVLNRENREILGFAAKAVALATGGAGKCYLYTSNPDIATGDGMAMAYRAGVPLSNMEFVQFHPTCLYCPEAKNFLISETVRGEGGLLLNGAGERFMPRIHPQAELAPRDIVARAIDAELKRSGAECVYLDISHRGADFIRKRFPNLYAQCLRFGFDMAKVPFPVVPAAHYFCGGAETDAAGRTELPGLYAIGEAAHTGLHGANRLASNSLLEACVFAHRAAAAASQEKKSGICGSGSSIPRWQTGGAISPDEEVVVTQNWDEIRRLLWNYVGIVRTDKRLQRAAGRMELFQKEIDSYYRNYWVTPDLLELRNIAQVAEILIRAAQLRKESRGLHYNLDHPSPQESLRTSSHIRRYPQKISVPSA
ncbi:MAG: L-aspartate oxidase [Elusimicrobia bacterium]|nr:L-aspartate oxidase [Elusimicrobiota bacterium]